MIALIPNKESISNLAVDGGEPEDQIHMTLLYLGEAEEFSKEEQEDLIDTIDAMLPGPISGKAFAHAAFNPNDEDKDPASVYLISDLPESLIELKDKLAGFSKNEKEYVPWHAHITAGYDIDVSELEFTGPIEFDKIRVCFGDQQTDFALD
jgi:2'-5' RNA ligase